MSIRDYITEKALQTPKVFNFADIEVEQTDEIEDGFDCEKLFKDVEQAIPRKFLKNLKKVKIEDREEFAERNVTALYNDGVLYLAPKLGKDGSMLTDIIHELAHHVETLYTNLIYGDESVQREFLRKRHELEFELRSEGYWTEEYDFEDINYSNNLDNFLYKRVGPNMLRLATSGMFIRPYAAVSIREYFATGFEAYYLGKREKLDKISPVLYDKIVELHTYDHQDLT